MSLLKKIINLPVMHRFVKQRLERVSIQHRITRVIFISCLMTLLVCLLFALLVIFTQRSLLVKNGEEVGEFATEVASEAILSQSITQTNDYLAAQANIMDDYLVNIQDNLMLVRDFIQELYKNQNGFLPVSTPYFTQVPKGQYAAHYMLDYGVSMNGLLRRELGLLGNAKYLIAAMMQHHPEIFTMYIVTETGLSLDFDDEAHTKQYMVDTKIIMRERPWYLLPKERGKVSITDLYEDDAGRGYCVTFCAPFYSGRGEFLGIIGADINLKTLSNIVTKIKGNGIDFVMLLGSESIIAHSLARDVSLEDDFEAYFDEVKGLPSGAIKKYMPDYTDDICVEKETYIIWESLAHTDWKLLGFAPIASIIAPSEQIRQNIAVYTSKFLNRAYIFANIIEILNLLLFFGIMGVCLYFARKTGKRISKPVQQLTKDALLIGKGDLDYIIKLETGDEIETLANTINKMVVDIKYITGEKERIGVELEVARQIQASMLPCIFPAFPHRNEFDLYGYMCPAKEVGGDFYDFYLVDEYKLAVVIADVSGKGVPAALFMVITKTLIKNTAQYGWPPSEVFKTVNNMLCENNEASMFVTAFLGILDLQTNVFTYVNAGHNPPYILHSQGVLERLSVKSDLVMGVMANTPYTQNEIVVKQGDMLYFYTDGVTEAVNKDNVMFSEDRLQEIIMKHQSSNLQKVVVNMVQEIDAFAESMEQADDITMLVMRIIDGR